MRLHHPDNPLPDGWGSDGNLAHHLLERDTKTPARIRTRILAGCRKITHWAPHQVPTWHRWCDQRANHRWCVKSATHHLASLPSESNSGLNLFFNGLAWAQSINHLECFQPVEESLNGNLRLCLTNFRKTHRPPEKIEIPCFMDVTTFLLSCDLFPSGRRRPECALSACTCVPSQTYIFSFMPSNMAAEHVVRSTDPKDVQPNSAQNVKTTGWMIDGHEEHITPSDTASLWTGTRRKPHCETSLLLRVVHTSPDGEPKREKPNKLPLTSGIKRQNLEVGKTASTQKCLILRNIPEPLCCGLVKLRMPKVLTISLLLHLLQENQYWTSRIMISRLQADSGKS